MTTVRITTSQLAEKAKNGYTVLINGHQKTYFQIRNMKGKTYSVTEEGKVLKTVNCQTL